MKIELFKAGAVVGEGRTVLNADAINELVNAINALVNMQFIPAGFGKLDVTEDGSATFTCNYQEIDITGICIEGVEYSGTFLVKNWKVQG